MRIVALHHANIGFRSGIANRFSGWTASQMQITSMSLLAIGNIAQDRARPMAEGTP
jgi:hypothetical protein